MAVSGTITKENDVVTITYSGGVQSYTIPMDGLYLLECYGAGSPNGKGGYSKGYKEFHKNDKIYICCGQKSKSGTTGTAYNGGGAMAANGTSYACSGAGATHMAKVSGTLASIGKTSFNTNGYLVAGGAGGSCGTWSSGGYSNVAGGNGGGTSGGSGSYNTGGDAGTGGSQSTGYAFGQGGNASASYVDDDDVKHNPSNTNMGGGGGGYYGGKGAHCTGSGGQTATGGGGSGWTGGVPRVTYKGVAYSPSMTTGGGTSNSNGSAYITLIKKSFPEIIINGVTLTGIELNGTELTDIELNGITLT